MTITASFRGFLFAVTIGFAFLILQTSCSTQRAIAGYTGDGEIFAMPDGGIIQGGGGYQVRFQPVKLDHAAQVSYHFAGLPKIAWQVSVFFAINDSREWIDRTQYEFFQKPSQIGWAKQHQLKFATYDDLAGTLSMTLKDSEGNVIFNVRHKLSEFVWCSSGKGPYELYDRDGKMVFTANSRKNYILDVSVEPDPTLKDDDGYVLFRSGGHEGLSL